MNYNNQGRHVEAEPLLLRALRARELFLGADHPHTLTSVSSLATLYMKQGRHSEARPLLLRGLKAR